MKSAMRQKLLSCSLSPNSTSQDHQMCWKFLLFPWNWRKWYEGEALQELEKNLLSFFGWKNVLLENSARGALFHALQTFGIKKGDEVLTQALSCCVVVNAIAATGARPIFVDIDPTTLNIDVIDLEKKITPLSKAILVQHTFGIPAPIDRIAIMAKNHQMKLIESLAHSFGNSFQGKKLGTWGDAAIFSFGRDKVISSIEGGGVGFKNRTDFTKKLPKMSRRRLVQDLLHPPLVSWSAKHYDQFHFGKFFLWCVSRGGVINKVMNNLERAGNFDSSMIHAYPNVLAQLTLQQWQNLPMWQAYRKRLAQHYHEKLSGLHGIQLFPNNSQALLRFPLLVKRKKALQAFLQKKNIILGDWYDSVITPLTSVNETKYYQRGSCPQAEKVSQSIVNLPTQWKISLNDANRITDAIALFYKTEPSRKMRSSSLKS